MMDKAQFQAILDDRPQVSFLGTPMKRITVQVTEETETTSALANGFAHVNPEKHVAIKIDSIFLPPLF